MIYSMDWDDSHIRQVPETLRGAGLTAKLAKCMLGADECCYLGHIVGKGRVRPEEAKVSAMKLFVQPRTKRDIRTFLGLAGYYHRFIKVFSTRAAALSDITRRRQRS